MDVFLLVQQLFIENFLVVTVVIFESQHIRCEPEASTVA